MSKALGYTRLSQQSDRSISAQKANIETYCEENGLELVAVKNDGEYSSGFKPEQLEEYQKVKEAILSGGVGAVVVNDKRRLVRDIDEIMMLIPQCRQSGVEIHSVQDGQMNLDDPMSAVIELVEAASEHKSKQKEIERAREAVAERMANGYDHGPPRFGMTYNDEGTRQVPGEKYDLVERVWELREDGATFEQIEEKTGVTKSTAHRIVNERDWYESRARVPQK
jgi:DNA invertase Pin-like site-specific DNA recombinase